MADLRKAEDSLVEANALMITQMRVFRSTKRQCAELEAMNATAGMENEVIDGVRCGSGWWSGSALSSACVRGVRG